MSKKEDKDVYSSDWFYCLSGNLLSILKSANCCVLLMEYVWLHNYFKKENMLINGRFFRSRRVIGERTYLSETAQRGIEQKLVSMGFIDIIVKGVPATNYIKLDMEYINSIIKEGEQTRNTETVSNKKEENSNSGRLSRMTNQIVTADKLYNSNNSNNTFINKSNGSTEPEKSRLIKKSTMQRKVRPSLINNPEPKKKNVLSKPIFISDVVKECIEYWNDNTVLVHHKVDLDCPSKTILLCKSLINSFLSGSLLDKAIIPEGFANKDLDRKQTVDDFKDHVDYLVYCINKSDVLPRKTDAKISIVTFLQGNSRFNIPAAILLYCFSKPKRIYVKKNEVVQGVIEFNHPRSPVNNNKEWLSKHPDLDETWFKSWFSNEEMTNRALSPKVLQEYKDIYSRCFGKYPESEESNKILEDTMYLCAVKNYKGNENGSIIFPGDNGHKSIFSILINENVWAKDKVGISFLKTAHFKEAISTFKNYTKTNRPNAPKPIKSFKREEMVVNAGNSDRQNEWTH